MTDNGITDFSNDKASQAASIWERKLFNSEFICHKSVEKIVKNTTMEAYVVNSRIDIRGALLPECFEQAAPASVDTYVNGICESLDKITVTIPYSFVRRDIRVNKYSAGIFSLRRTGKYLTIEMHGEYIPPDCNLKEHVYKVLNYLAFTERLFQQPIKRISSTQIGENVTLEEPHVFIADEHMTPEEFLDLLYRNLNLKCIEFATDSLTRLSDHVDKRRLVQENHCNTFYTIDCRIRKKIVVSRSVMTFYNKKKQLLDKHGMIIDEELLERCEVRIHAGQYSCMKDIDILDTDYYGIVNRVAPYIHRRLRHYGYGDGYFDEMISILPDNAYALRKFLIFKKKKKK